MNKSFAFFFEFAVILLFAALDFCCAKVFRFPRVTVESISDCQLSHQTVKAERHAQSRHSVAVCIVILLQSIYFCNNLSVRWFIIMCCCLQGNKANRVVFRWWKKVNEIPHFPFSFIYSMRCLVLWISSNFQHFSLKQQMKLETTLENGRTKTLCWKPERI